MKRDNKKVAARRSPNCIRKTKKNKIRRFLKWLWDHHIEFASWQQPAKWHVALGWYVIEFARWHHPACNRWLWDDMTLNSPGGSTLQCDTWLWDHDADFAQTSAVLEFYFWLRCRPYRCSRHVLLHQCSKFLSKSDHLRQKNDVI